MRSRWAPILALVAAAGLAAQTGISYGQLRQFIRASVDQGLKDKDVANYLKRQVVRFRVDEALVAEFVGWGVGPRTLKALEELRAATAGFAEPDSAPDAPKAARQPPPPSAEEQDGIVETARGLAQTYSEDLPNHVCVQVTRRFIDPTGTETDWRRLDEIKTVVSYVDGHEEYEVLSVNDTATTKSFSDLGGTTSTGEFGTILKSLFAAKTAAEFRWARHSLLRGHSVYVFHIRVPKGRSGWSLVSSVRPNREGLRTIRSGYTGLVYIDKESGRVLRIVMEAEGIPASFPVDEVRSRLDFDFIEIGDQTYLLPLKAQAFIRKGRELTRNDIEFRLYRRFIAEATISFDDIEGLEPLPDDEPQEGLRAELAGFEESASASAAPEATRQPPPPPAERQPPPSSAEGQPPPPPAEGQLPPPSPEEQDRVVETARRLAQAYSEALPNFVCLQLTRRFVDPAGMETNWLLDDEIKTRVRYVDGHEEYGVLSVNGTVTTKSFFDLGGSTSTGEFGTILQSVFATQTAAEFRWAHHSLLRGHPAYVFHIRVPKNRSGWSLISRDGPVQTVRSGYTGMVYIDKESGRVLRIVMEAEAIPASFPMDEVRSRLDFDFIEVSDQTYLLPLKAQAFIRKGRVLTRNEIEFRLYRKFTAESTISFEDTVGLEPLPEDEPREELRAATAGFAEPASAPAAPKAPRQPPPPSVEEQPSSPSVEEQDRIVETARKLAQAYFYRKFAAEPTISFEDTVGLEPLPEDEPQEELRAATAGFAEPASAPVAPKAARQTPAPSAEEQLPPPSVEEQDRIFETARRLAQTYSEDLPNFVCLQLTRRFYNDPTGTELLWRRRDEIKTRVSYVDGREKYEMLSVNDTATAKGFSDLGGTASTGEFGTLLKNVFSARTAAEFRWARHSLLRGRPVHVFHIRVPKSRSDWSLIARDGAHRQGLRTIRSGYTGLVHIDKESGRALRIVIAAEGIPASFPVDVARSHLDFDFIEISGQTYLLPLKALAFIRQGRWLWRNEIEFRLYRKFTAEATISFGDTVGLEPLPEDEPQE